MDERKVHRARQLAADLADAMSFELDQKNANRILSSGGSYHKIKEEINMARKPRMRTVEQYLCDQCDHIIQDAQGGFVVKGNVYTADPTGRGGLIGNNFPETKEGETIDPDAVKETVLCVSCFLSALGLHDIPKKRSKPKEAITDVADILAKTLRHEVRR
jgi:hypothetical protein